MKKILITVGGFFPAKKFGGPAVSILNLCNLLDEEFCIVVLTANHDLNSKEKLEGIQEGKNSVSNFYVYYLSEEEINLNGFKRIIEREKPDMIYVNSLFSAKYFLPAIHCSNEYGIPLIIAPRGELCDNAFKKKAKKIVYINYIKARYGLRNTYVHITADNELEGVKKYIQKTDEKIFKIDNVPTLPNTIEKIADKRPSECRIIFISRIHPKKNLKFALEIISNIKSNIIFDIYGPIEDEEYWSVCKELIEKMPENIDARYCGLLEHEEVMNTFRKYHLFFFPTFSENYGHVIVESLLSGCPVLTSDQVPWTDMQSYGCGFSFPLDARKDFINAVDVVSGWTQSEFNEAVSKCSEYTNDKIDFVKLKEKYCNMFNTATGSNATLGAK